MVEFSIHLITYNNEKHIEETLQSILKQKVDFDYEIVVGDDCSTDKTLTIIKQYETRYPKLFKIQKNESQLGILKNFKATLDRCVGKYIFDIAGDDLLKTEDAMQKMVDVFRNNNTLGFIDCGFDSLNDIKNTTTIFKNKKAINSSNYDYKRAIMLGQIAPIGICYNKDSLYKYVDFDSYIKKNITIEDYPILIDLIMNTDFHRINESLHIYRVHDESFSHKRDFEKNRFSSLQMKKLFDYFCDKYKFKNDIIEEFNLNHLKQLLFFAGFYEKKAFGNEIYSKIKSKSIKDYIHYWASQYPLFRKLISII